MRIRVIDVESTGDTPEEQGLCEIGYHDVVSTGVDLGGVPTMWVVERGEVSLCNPGVAISVQTSAVHHIIDSDVANSPRWEVIAGRFTDNPSITGPIDLFCAHGADHEKKYLLPFTRETPFIDTWKCALHIYLDAPGHSNQTLKYFVRPDGMERELTMPAHRAGPDAYVTAYLLRDMLNFHTTPDQLVKWSSEPALLRVCKIGKWRGDNHRGTPWEQVDEGFLRWMLDPSKSFGPNEIYTARHHLERREFDQREERERLALQQQLSDNGLADVPPAAPIANDNKDLFS